MADQIFLVAVLFAAASIGPTFVSARSFSTFDQKTFVRYSSDMATQAISITIISSTGAAS